MRFCNEQANQGTGLMVLPDDGAQMPPTESTPVHQGGESQDQVAPESLNSEDLSLKLEKEKRYQSTTESKQDIESVESVVPITDPLAGKTPAEFQPVLMAPTVQDFAFSSGNQEVSVVGEAIPLVESRRATAPAPSAFAPMLLLFLASFSVCSAALNVYLFWQARNLGAELEKRPPAPKSAPFQKR